LVNAFEQGGGGAKPRYGQLTVCYADSEEAAAQAVRDHWPNAAIGGDLMTDLPLPTHFEQAVELIQPDKITADMPLGPDPKNHIAGIEEFADAGFDHIYIHQVGPNQDNFFRFYGERILPHFVD
jgi:coenzyme F420-dependent glucose-6-phosphate dehydrogenase